MPLDLNGRIRGYHISILPSTWTLLLGRPKWSPASLEGGGRGAPLLVRETGIAAHSKV